MKRAFRIALLLGLTLATVLIFAACNKTPAHPDTTTPEQTTPETTTPAEIQDPNVPQGSVPVDTLNGMNATQLYEAFIEEYFSSAQFDIELTIEQTDGDDVVLASSIATKISDNAVYYSLAVDGLMDGKPMEVWLIDDVAFVNGYGEKIKRENIATIDEIIGEGALDAVWGSFKQDLPKEYLDALATAQLYRLNDVYFYTITVSIPNTGYDSITETVSFDKNGKVISVTDIADGYYTKGIIHSYGKPVEILPPEDADEYMPEFIPVDTLNGLNAAQLYENFVHEYNNSTTYDIQFTQIQHAGTYSFTTSKNIIVNEDNLCYRYARNGYTQTEIYLIGDVAYINVEGNKIKYFRTDVTAVYGENFLAPIAQLISQEVPTAYYTALETAQLYFDTINDTYYYTVTFFATEESTIPTTETVYFDNNGKLIKITDITGDFDKEIIIKCGTPVEVLPPEYPGEYYVAPKIPLTEEEIYLFYVDACTYLQNTQFLEAYIDAPGIDTDTYHRYGENKYIYAYVDSQSTRRWILDNSGFVQIGWNTALKTPIDAAFLKHFTDVENLLPLHPFQQEELQNISCFYDMRVGRIFVTFERVDESGALFLYEYAVWDNEEWVDVDITKYVDGVKIETSAFNFIIDPLRPINPPN